MQEYKRDFIEFMVRSDVLTFGDFTTKSGRQTPFFINTGRYRTGEQLAQLGEFYAAAIDESWPDDVDILFGPAYKGIPLVATASIGLAARGRDIGYLFNRKEAKDHGEGGVLVGALPADGDRVLSSRMSPPQERRSARRCRSCRPMPTSTSSASSSPPIGRNAYRRPVGTRPGRPGLFDDDASHCHPR